MTEYKLLTLRQISEHLQITERDAGQLLRNGYLPGYKLGREWRISLDDLNSFIRKHGNLSRDQLRSGHTANGHNGAHREIDSSDSAKEFHSNGRAKTNNGAEEGHSARAQCEIEPNWVPPWRQEEV